MIKEHIYTMRKAATIDKAHDAADALFSQIIDGTLQVREDFKVGRIEYWEDEHPEESVLLDDLFVEAFNDKLNLLVDAYKSKLVPLQAVVAAAAAAKQ